MPWAAKNDSRRGYGIRLDASQCIRQYNTPKWESAVEKMLKVRLKKETGSEKATHVRNTIYANNRAFKMSPGIHNRIQKTLSKCCFRTYASMQKYCILETQVKES